MSKSPDTFSINISIPFESAREANIVSRSLLVDLKNEPSRMSALVTKEVINVDKELIINITTNTLKSLRVNVNSILDFILLLIDTINKFDLKN